MTVRSWKINGLTVECALDVLQQISAAARDGFMRFPHGGLEVGGLVIGEGRGDVLRITGIQPLAIEYGRGASFILTEGDEAALRTLIAQTPDVAGWYVSHTRRGAVLTDRDKVFYEQFFGDAGQVCLIIKPAVDGAETWALYVRDASGAVIPAGSYQDVEADSWEPLARSAVASTAIAEPVIEAPAREPEPPVETPVTPRPQLVPRIVQQPQPVRRRNWTRPATVAGVLLAFTGGAWYLSGSRGDAQRAAQAAPVSGDRNRATQEPVAPTPAAAAVAPAAADASPAIEKPAEKPSTRAKHTRRVRTRARHRR